MVILNLQISNRHSSLARSRVDIHRVIRNLHHPEKAVLGNSRVEVMVLRRGIRLIREEVHSYKGKRSMTIFSVRRYVDALHKAQVGLEFEAGSRVGLRIPAGTGAIDDRVAEVAIEVENGRSVGVRGSKTFGAAIWNCPGNPGMVKNAGTGFGKSPGTAAFAVVQGPWPRRAAAAPADCMK
jgi:hypothetical protein